MAVFLSKCTTLTLCKVKQSNKYSLKRLLLLFQLTQPLNTASSFLLSTNMERVRKIFPFQLCTLLFHVSQIVLPMLKLLVPPQFLLDLNGPLLNRMAVLLSRDTLSTSLIKTMSQTQLLDSLWLPLLLSMVLNLRQSTTSELPPLTNTVRVMQQKLSKVSPKRHTCHHQLLNALWRFHPLQTPSLLVGQLAQL